MPVISRSLALCAALCCTCAIAQAPPAGEQLFQTERDGDAVTALEVMGTSLRSAQDLSLTAQITRESVLTSGQKVQFGGTIDIDFVRPNKLRLDVKSDRQERSLFYDGKSLTVFSPRLGYYASVDAPGTVAETLALATARYGIEFPLADLFSWGTDMRMLDRIDSAFRVGTETIGDRTCRHYAFRQQGVDWQIWIEDTTFARPCKLVITTTDDPAQPQYTATLNWKRGAEPSASRFAFTPPQGARKIALADLRSQGADQ